MGLEKPIKIVPYNEELIGERSTLAPQIIFVNAILMPDGEIICCGKTIGFKDHNVDKKYIFELL